MWNRPGFRATYDTTASRYGASYWSAMPAESMSAAPRAVRPVGRLAAGVLRVRVPPFLWLHLALDVDVLRLLEGLEALASELAAEAGLLEPAERAGVVVGQGIFEPDRPCLDLTHAAEDRLEVLRVDVRPEPVRRRVREHDCLIEALHRHERGDRAEGLLPQQIGLGGGAGDHRRRVEVAAVPAPGVPTDDHIC